MADGEGAPQGASARSFVRTKGAVSCPAREFTCGEVFELAQAGSDWIWETDAELRFSWLSENYEEATGVPAEQVLGRFRFDFLKQGPGASKQAEAHLDDLQSRRAFRDFVYEFVAGRSDCRWVSVTGFPRFSTEGAFLGYRGVGRNVTGLIVSSDRETEAEAARRRLADVLESHAGGRRHLRSRRQVRLRQQEAAGFAAGAEGGLAAWPLLPRRFRCTATSRLFPLQRRSRDRRSSTRSTSGRLDRGHMRARYHLRHFEFERRNPDGRWFQVYRHAHRRRHLHRRAHRHHRDASSARRRCARACARSDLYRHVLDELPVAAYVKSDDLRFEFVNKAWSSISLAFPRSRQSGQTDRTFRRREAKVSPSDDPP